MYELIASPFSSTSELVFMATLFTRLLSSQMSSDSNDTETQNQAYIKEF
jgi:hypothetical protein